MANYTRDKEYILKQLAMAKETLAKLRALTDPKKSADSFNGQNGILSPWMDSVNAFDDYKHDSDERSSGVGMESPHFDFQAQSTNLLTDKSSVARDSLVKALGLQVSKLEDDLKVALLSYLEQMEDQKEELISSFETMHAQLAKHHEICQEHYRETAEKDACIERLKVDKQTLEMDVEKLRRENMELKAESGCTRENGYRLSPGFVEHDELSETLMKENSRLREMLRKYKTNDYTRMERKVALQEKLCESYNKDVMSKDSLVKRLKAENRGLHEDVKNLQDEILRVNANRLNAEQDKTRLHQELQFSEEQISTLREKLNTAAEETRYLQRCLNDANSKANISGGNLSELEKEILALRGKCESYRDKLNDKERFLASVTKENEGLRRAVDAMKREFTAVKGEERSLKIENERLQKENADREIDRLSSETATEANSSKISKMKQELHDLESKVGELEQQRQEHEDRETELNQEVITNLEKYTQVEQQLYLTKKELAQLRGFYDSNEAQKRDLQEEAEDCRQRIASLERQLEKRQRDDAGNERMNDIMKEKEGLSEENQRLREEFETSKTEIEELEEALQNAREQNSLQRMRLDAHDTLMKRKDERIKELQNELVELHNEMDALTDGILKKNREMEGLRMSKRLLEQELDLLRSGKLPVKSLYREVTVKDSSQFFPTADPASPDSGFSDMERERAIDRLRREILSQPQHPVLYEETLATSAENEKNRADLALATRRLRETEKKLAEVIAENENLKDQEQEARSLHLQINEELRKVIDERNELEKNEKRLKQALEEKLSFVTQSDSAETLESQVEEENLFAFDEHPIAKPFLQPVLKTIPENATVCLENELEESLIDFMDESDGLNSQLPQVEVTRLQKKSAELERKVQDYEKRLAKLSAEKEELLSELTGIRENLENEGKVVQENKKGLQSKAEELKDTIDDYESSLAKVNAENEELLLELKDMRENLREMEYECKASRKNREELQNKTEELEGKIDDLETLLAKMNGERDRLLSELKRTQENLKEIENECRAEQENRAELQKIMQEELSAKDDDVAKLQKELSVLCEERERLQSFVESSKETACDTDEKLLKAQNIILDLEKQQSNSRTQEKSLRDLLHQSEDSNASLQVQLGEMEQAYRKMDKESKALQQQILLEQQGSAELEREVEELREKVAVEEDKQKKLTERLEDLQKQNERLRQQLKDAEQALKNSHQENKKTVLKLEDAIREKENDIEELREELSISEQRYTEIKSLSGNNQTEISVLQAELIESKEQFYTVSQEKARLLHDQKEFENDIDEKDQKIAVLEAEKSEDKRKISEEEKKGEELFEKVKDREIEAKKLTEENKSLKKSVEQAAISHKELESLLTEYNEEKKALEQQLLAAHESITDLETAFERSEDKNSQTEENLREAKKRIVKLEMQLEARQNEYRALERDYNETEKELEKAQETLESCQDKIAILERKLRAAEENVSDLEMARDNGLTNEQLLQQRFANASESVEKMEVENDELREKLTKMEKKLGDLLSKEEMLEDKNEELDKVNKELRKELEYEKDKRLALKQKVENKDRENDAVQRKVQILEKSIAEKEDLQNKGVEEKAKLREELTRAKKNISELETTKENQEESIHELEECLRETRGKTATLEQKLEDSLRDNVDLHEELEEVNRKLKYTKEENYELEKSLQKQKEISDGFRSNLSEKEESVMNSNYNRDVAERSVQSLKKELARKDAKLKMQKEQIDDMENEAEKAGRKVKETESANKRLTNENERLVKELADIKAKVAKLGAMHKERGNAVSESDVPVVRVSEVQSSPIEAEKLIRDWSDKLSTAQVKVTDLEKELLKDIKKHEAKVHRARPVPPEFRRKSADNVLTDYPRPSRFRSRQRPNTSRDSSVDSLRSTQSMLDYLDERIVNEKFISAGLPVASNTGLPTALDAALPVTSATPSSMASETGSPPPSENATPVPSETSTPVAAGNGTPVTSDTESSVGLPVTTTARVKSVSAPIKTLGTADDKEPTTRQDSRCRESSEKESDSLSGENNLFDFNLEEILEPHVDFQPSLSSGQTALSNKEEDLADERVGEETDLNIDYQQSLLIEPPEHLFDVKSATDLDERNNYGQALSTEGQSNKTTPPKRADIIADAKTEATPDQHSVGEQLTSRNEDLSRDIFHLLPTKDKAGNVFNGSDEEINLQPHFQQPLLIEPPSDDMFQFESVHSDNSSSFTNTTDLAFQSPSPVFPEHKLLVTFDPLDASDSHPYKKDKEEILDPFEQLMRDTQYKDRDQFDINDIDEVNDDVNVTNNLLFDLQEAAPMSIDHGSNEPMNIVDTDHVTHGASVDSPPVPYECKRTSPTSDLGCRDLQPINAASNDLVTDEESGDVIDSPNRTYSDITDSPKSIEPVSQARKMKENLTPVLFPIEDRKQNKDDDGKKSEKSDVKPYSVMIMVDDEIVEKSSGNELNPSGREEKPKRPPKPMVLEGLANLEEEEISTSPSKIRKKLENEIVRTLSGKSLNRATDGGKVKPSRPPRPVVPAEFANTEGKAAYNSPSQIKKELKEDKSSYPAEVRKKKTQRPPKPLVPAEFANTEDDTFKSPSQIRKELEEASKRGQRTVIGPKPTGRQKKTQVTENRSAQYHIEENKKENVADHTHVTEQKDEEKEMGKGRLLKLIAAFNNK